MKLKLAAVSLLAAASLAMAPVSPASAHEWRHHHGFPIIGGLIGAGVAVGTAVAAVATAPVRIVANAAAPYPYYAPVRAYAPPVYYAAPPAPVYAYPAYGYPGTVVYSAPQPVYAYPQ